jgi:hypothetical protein
MDRVVVNRSFTLYKTFYADGVATDPTGTPTVVITRASTGAVVTTGAVTDEAAVGTWSVTVAATQNTLLDTLTVTWTATVNATPQQYVDIVEVAGDTICTIADLPIVECGTLTRVQTAGGAEDYSATATLTGADKFDRQSQAACSSATSTVSRDGSDSTLVVERTIAVNDALAVTWARGDILTYTYRSNVETGTVRDVKTTTAPGLPGVIRLALRNA